jgi:curli biogenesis system outer membrane secretion channel CsgG
MVQRGKHCGRNGLVFAVLFIILILLCGCATKIRVNMLQPAQYHEASLTKAVAVLPFNGPGGTEFAAEIEGVLAGIGIDDKPYFTLVDRASVDKIISEMKFSQSGLVDPKTAVKLGKMVGAQGIYTGVVTQNDYSDSRYAERRQTCTQYEMRRDEKGRTYQGPCVRWRTYHVQCTKRVANFAVSPKLVDVATGRVIYSRNLSAVTNSSGCEDTNPIQSEMVLLEQAKSSVKNAFRRDIAPYYITREIRLIDSTDGIESKEAKDKLKRGMDYADHGRMDSACELWGQARNLAPGSYALLYNLGVCAESRGDLDAALQLYRQADQILGKPDDDISLALTRVGEAIKNRGKIKEALGQK